MPMFLDPSTKIAPTYQSGFIVVGTVISCAGMRNIYRDHGNAGFAILCGDDWGDGFVRLELDCQIDLLAHKQVRVALSDFGVIPIIERNEFNTFSLSRPLQAAGDLARKLIIGALGSVAQTAEPL